MSGPGRSVRSHRSGKGDTGLHPASNAPPPQINRARQMTAKTESGVYNSSKTKLLRGGAEAARQAHNLEVVGSNPIGATRTEIPGVIPGPWTTSGVGGASNPPSADWPPVRSASQVVEGPSIPSDAGAFCLYQCLFEVHSFAEECLAPLLTSPGHGATAHPGAAWPKGRSSSERWLWVLRR